MAYNDRYDAPYDRGSRYEDRRYETYTRERERDRDTLRPYPASRDLVRHRDSDLSVEEVPRDFPPPGYRDRRARSAEPGYDYDGYSRRAPPARGPASVYYQQEEERRKKRAIGKQEKILAAVAGAAIGLAGKEAYDRYDAKKDEHEVERNYLQSAALGAAGAFAGYQGAEFYNKHAAKEEKHTTAVYRGRDGRIEYYSDDDVDPPAKKGQKKFLESMLGVSSMGGVMKMLTGDDKSSRRSRSSSRSTRRSRRGSDTRGKIQKAALASLIAGATEAFRVSKEPGSWKGEKVKRVATAAMGAGALGGAHNEGHNKMDIFESVLGGLVGNRLVHGSKSNIEADEYGRSRSRSRASRSRARSSSRHGGGGHSGAGIAALTAAIAGGIGAKKLAGSRSRSRSRRRGSSSDGSRSPSRRRQRSRSRSVVDKARNSLARLGIGGGAGSDRDSSSDRGSRRASSRRRRYSDDYDNRRGGGGSSYYDDDDRSYPSRRRGGGSRRSDAGSETDLGDSEDDAKRARKIRGKQILTTGLAGVATIHAAHEVYQSMEKRQIRQKAVKEGRLSPAEAKKLKTKAMLQDAASVGVAALGIKGAIGELKEARELRQEVREFNRQKRERAERRAERRSRSTRPPERGGWSNTGSPRRDYDDGYYDDGYYTDGNPYSATLPAPPVGYHDRR